MQYASFELNQIVWAKISGHPWWPAYIVSVAQAPSASADDDKLITVNFIGENTHAVLPTSSVCDFMDNYSTYSKFKKRKLQDAIDLAHSIAQGEESIQKIFKFNTRRKESVSSDCPDKPNLTTEFRAKLKALESSTDICPPTQGKSELACDVLLRSLDKHRLTISTIMNTAGEGVDLVLLNELADCFIQLMTLQCHSEVFQSVALRSLIREVQTFFSKSKSINLRKLAKVAERLLAKCKPEEIADIPNSPLRKRVCQRIAASLQSINYDKAEAQELALVVEAKLRKKDPSMGATYRHYFNCLHKDIKRLSVRSPTA